MTHRGFKENKVKKDDYRFDVNGVELTAAASPCVWM